MEKILQNKSLDIYVLPCLFVRDKAMLIALPLNNILFLQAENAYTRIVTLDPKENYLSSLNLGRIEQKLCFPSFCRIHRSYIVNLHHVSAIVNNGLKIEKYYIPVGKNYRHIMNAFILV